jgi:hypothetical protein
MRFVTEIDQIGCHMLLKIHCAQHIMGQGTNYTVLLSAFVHNGEIC